MSTAAEILRSHATRDTPALFFEDRSWTYRELIAEACRRAALLVELTDPDRPPHVGVLLDNEPEYLFWLAGAALSGGVVVGINSTYRGDQLGQLIRHTDCQLIVTNPAQRGLLGGVDTGVPDDRVLDVGTDAYRELVSAQPTGIPTAEVTAEDLLLLIFTSGSTGMPKAVRCTQGRYARTGAHVASIAELTDADVIYTPLPFFHSSSLFTGWASAINAGIPVATRASSRRRARWSTSVGAGATMLTYTGKVLNYILATPERPDDADNPLRLAVGNEASDRDIREFARRFGCNVRDSYGSTEGIIIIRREPVDAGRCARLGERVGEGDRSGDRRGVPAGRVRCRRPSDEPRGGDR